jgi:hypothetical protein
MQAFSKQVNAFETFAAIPGDAFVFSLCYM